MTAALIVFGALATIAVILVAWRRDVAELAGLRVRNEALEAAAARGLPGPSLAGHTVVVHTQEPDDRSVRGVVVADHADRVALKEAVFLVGKTGTELAGLQWFERGNLSMIQQLPDEATG